MARSIPIIDISTFIDGSDKGSVVQQVDEACRDLGFLVIRGHGVPQTTLDATIAAMQAFFDQPVEEKQRHQAEGFRGGYSEFANMSLGQSFGREAPADLREGFAAKRADIYNPQSPAWGDSASTHDMRLAFADHYAAMNRVADVLMRIFALALGKPEDYFEYFTYRHNSNLGVFHYPPMTEAPLPGQLRGGAHTDFGSVTVLYGSPSVHGLQIWNGEEWEDAPVEHGTFVVNLGDLMQRWTNDVWSSTIHRVANPADGDWDQARLSLAFFHQPNADALIENLDVGSEAKYPTITSGEHFAKKMEAMLVTAK
jgi:isopenicillin N synthase-like dioxygenase